MQLTLMKGALLLVCLVSQLRAFDVIRPRLLKGRTITVFEPKLHDADDIPAIQTALFEEGYRARESGARGSTWLSHRESIAKVSSIQLKLLETQIGSTTKISARVNFEVTIERSEFWTTAHIFDISAILLVRNHSSSQIETFASRPKVSLPECVGRPPLSGCEFTSELFLRPGEYSVRAIVLDVQHNCFPNLLGDTSVRLIVHPSLNLDEFRAAVADSVAKNEGEPELVTETISNCLRRMRLDKSVLDALAELPGEKHLDLTGCGLEDSELDHLSRIPQVTRLTLRNGPISNQLAREFVKCRDIRSLDFSESRIDAGPFKELCSHRSNPAMRLHGCALSSEHFRQLSQSRILQQLDLSTSSMTDLDLRYICEMSQLNVLDISGTSVSTQGISHLASLKNLTHLDVSGTRIDDEALIWVSKLSRLETLGIAGTSITSDALRKLVPLLKLKQIIAGRSLIKHLKTEHPHIKYRVSE